MKCVALLGALVGCGRVGFDPAPDVPPDTVTAGCPDGMIEGPYTATLAAQPPWARVRAEPGASATFADASYAVSLAPNDAYVVFDANNAMADARTRLFRVHVLEVPRKVVGTEALLAWYLDEDNKVGIGVVGDRFIATLFVNTNAQTMFEPATDLTDRWWQLRSDGTTLFAEASPDALRWRALASYPVPSFLSTVDPTIGVGTTASVTNPGTARFDQLLDCVSL